MEVDTNTYTASDSKQEYIQWNIQIKDAMGPDFFVFLREAVRFLEVTNVL